MEIAEQKARCCAVFCRARPALHPVCAGRHVFAEIDRRDPEAHDSAAHAVGNSTGSTPLPRDFEMAGLARRAFSRRWRRESRVRGRAERQKSAAMNGTSRDAGRRPRDTGPQDRSARLSCSRRLCMHRSGRGRIQTANQLTPESNQTSRMSVSLRKDSPLH